jgi:hypothetical protein
MDNHLLKNSRLPELLSGMAHACSARQRDWVGKSKGRSFVPGRRCHERADR